MSTFVIVPGAWDAPATLEPVIEPLGSVCLDVIVVELPCGSHGASLGECADAMRAGYRDDLSRVVLVGYVRRWLRRFKSAPAGSENDGARASCTVLGTSPRKGCRV